MTQATFAACVGDGDTFAADEQPTGPTSTLASKTRSFWLAPQHAVNAPATETPEVRIPSRRSSRPPAAEQAPSHVVRKVAAASLAMQRVAAMLGPLARAEVTVTLMGETGTGKDVLARTIH